VVQQATSSVGLDPGVGGFIDDGSFVLQNVGNVSTTVAADGSITVQRGTDILLRLVR
jgi:hypothetical protein